MQEIPPDIVEFKERYMALPRTGAVPSLRSFLDAALFKFMPSIVIIDVSNADDFKVRLLGSRLSDSIGRDFTGISAQEIRSQNFETGIGPRSWLALNHPCGYLSRR